MRIKFSLALISVLFLGFVFLPYSTVLAMDLYSSESVFNKNFNVGANDNDIIYLQKFLNKNGYIVSTSGPGSTNFETQYFGVKTKLALIKFQEANSDAILKPAGLINGTGYFGPVTRNFINNLKINTGSINSIILTEPFFSFNKNLKIGESGNDIIKLQEVLRKEGLYTSTLNSGIFDLPTFQSVIKFQEKYRSEILIPASLSSGNGFVGVNTRNILNKKILEYNTTSLGVKTISASSGGVSNKKTQITTTNTSNTNTQPTYSSTSNTSIPSNPTNPPTTSTPTTQSITQYGITWTFDKPYQYGQFINGDYWVKGPVTIVDITPKQSTGRNGSVVNPVTGKQGYDNRVEYYDENIRLNLPATLSGNKSLVSSVSLTGTNCTSSQGIGNTDLKGTCLPERRTYLKTAAVLTIVDSDVEQGTFRPAFIGNEKKFFNEDEIEWNRLPKFSTINETPKNISYYQRVLERPWISHIYDWTSRTLHPIENMLNYHEDIYEFYANLSLLTLFNIPEREDLVIKSIQNGIDTYAMVLSGYAGSGTAKWPILFAGTMLDDSSMENIFINNTSKTLFREDLMTYYSQEKQSKMKSATVATNLGWTGATVLWRQQSGDQEHEHLHPSEWSNVPPSGGGCKHEAYRVINSVHWPAFAIFINLLDLENKWNHPAFIDYTNRWMKEDMTSFSSVLNQYCGSVNINGYKSSTFINKMWQKYMPNDTEAVTENQNETNTPTQNPTPTPNPTPNPVSGSQTPQTQSSDLVVHYTFDSSDISGSVVSDKSGNDIKANIVGSINSVSGKKGQALELTGINNYFASNELNKKLKTISDPSFSISLWVKPKDFIGNYALFGFGSHPSIRFSASNSLRFCQNSKTCTASPSAGLENEWQNIIVTYDNTVYKVYFNGNKILETNSIEDLSNISSVYSLYIGSSSASNYYFKGAIDELKVFNKALNQTEVYSLQNI